MATRYFLVLLAVSVVASGQIIFGGNTGGRTGSASSGTTSPGRGTINPGRGTVSPGRGTVSPGRGPVSPGRGTVSPGRGAAGGTGASGRSCTSPEGLPGVCRPPAGCVEIQRRIRQKDASYIRTAFCGRTQGKILLCCADSHQTNPDPVIISFGPPQQSSVIPVRNTPPPPIQTEPPSRSNTSPFQPSNPAPSEPSGPGSSVFSAPSCPRFRSASDCGRSPFTPSRVVNGVPVQSLADFPWMAALRYSTQPPYKCGGAVINDRWIITAAHCILTDGPTDVVIGDLNLNTDTDDSTSHPPQTIAVQLTARHPNYRRSIRGNDKGLFNDIALIKLARRIQLSEVVRPICLDSRPGAISELEGSQAIVAGWGATTFAGLGSPVMQWGRVEISNQRSCRIAYARRGNRVDSSSQLCASGLNDRGGVDTCHGDSGGPLMEQRSRNNLKRWYAVGIVSYGTGCGSPETPGVYTHIGAHLDWIGCTVSAN